jgi:3',5'-cyclic AMP phosphodiesterase CpdA
MSRIRLFLLALVWMLGLGRASAEEPWFFIQLSDPQLGFFSANQDVAQEAANFEFVVANVNRLRPEFVIVTGDLVHKPGDPEQIAEYRRILAKIDPTIPVHHLSGNHDLENTPTPQSIASYAEIFGPDRFTFRHRNLVGIVLNSTLIHTPDQAPDLLEAQTEWLKAELEKAKQEKPGHIVVFQHHPWFLKSADEPDGYSNIPLERRRVHLDLFRQYGVRYSFSGHLHRNAEASDGDFANITTGAVGKPLGGSQSGFRVVIVREDRIDHRFYELGQLPVKIELSEKEAPAKKGAQ